MPDIPVNSILRIVERVGDKVRLTDEDREITISMMREIDGHLVIVGDDGGIYSEDEVDIRYSLSQPMILFNFLQRWKLDFYEEPEEDDEVNVFQRMFDDLMNDLVKYRIVIPEPTKSVN